MHAVVSTCCTTSPIMPIAVGRAGSFLHEAADTCHPPSPLHKLSVLRRRWCILLLEDSERNYLL